MSSLIEWIILLSFGCISTFLLAWPLLFLFQSFDQQFTFSFILTTCPPTILVHGNFIFILYQNPSKMRCTMKSKETNFCGPSKIDDDDNPYKLFCSLFDRHHTLQIDYSSHNNYEYEAINNSKWLALKLVDTKISNCVGHSNIEYFLKNQPIMSTQVNIIYIRILVSWVRIHYMEQHNLRCPNFKHLNKYL